MSLLTMEDSALPVDFNESANPDQLTDVAWNTHLEYADGSKPMVTKAGSGRMSPVRARTMKEYDQQIAELKKENFSLKLRIYFLEERMQQKFDGEGEDLFKTNIELKVETESLKRELLDKQDLLKKASTALESISAQHQVELDQAHAATHQTSDEHLQQIQAQLESKDEELASIKNKLDQAEKELLDMVTSNRLRLDSPPGDDQPDKGHSGGSSELEEKDKYIRQLQAVLKTKELIIEQQDEERKDALNEAQKQIEELQKALTARDQRSQELDIQLGKLEKENTLHEENALKRDKAIQGLAALVQKKTMEVERLQNGLGITDSDGRESRTTELELEDQVAELETLLREKQQENDRIQKAISRREAEVGRLTQQLEKADDKMRQREDALQDLREQLREEKRRNTEKTDSLTNHYQAMLDDAQRQLQNQEKMLQHLSKSLQDKDRQLHDYMHTVQEQQPTTEKQSTIIASLRNQLRDKEEAIEAAIEDKYKTIEERDLEIRQVKTALRERDRDIERANQMLLTTEESIDAQETEAKERDQALRQATAALKAQQRANEDQQDAHQRAMEEKEILIQRLQNSLNFKDKTLQDTIRASPSATDAMIQQLQHRLQEKDNLLQELMLERSRAAEVGETSNRELHNKLRSKDRELKEMQEKANEQAAELTHQIQGLQSDLNKKDYELQTIENRATWSGEQQQEMLDKMRAAINEKDKTIETLLEGAREKDRLFRQMQEQSPDAFSQASTSKLAELQQSKDEVARLENELQKKEDLIDRLRVAAERRSPKPDMVPRRQLDFAEDELSQRTEALTRALRGEKEAKRGLNELRKRLQAAGVSELSDIGRLQDEIARLRKEVERPGTPQRLQTTVGGETNLHLTQMLRDQLQEAQRLSEALRSEREIYVNINQVGNAPQSDQARAFEIELLAVQSLRQQLSDGVERNNRIRSALEVQLATNEQNKEASATGDNTETLEAMQTKLRNLQTQLEESSRWNTSLQARLSQQTLAQQRGGGVGATQEPDNSIAMSPARPTSSALGDDSLMFSQSFIPSFRQLPDSELTHSEADLEHMSLSELKKAVMQLQEQLVTSRGNCAGLREQLSNALSHLPRDIPGENNQDQLSTTPGVTLSPTDQRDQLEELEKDVRKLREQLRHTEHLNDLLKQQIALNTQTESVPSGFNPELIVEMANEIQRLKDELEKRRQSTSDEGSSMVPPPSPLGKNGAEAQRALQKQMESLRTENNEQKAESTEDLESQNKMLRGKLASTEATVRSQTDKVRHYRRLLEEAGLLTPLHRRSCSESSLSNLGTESPGKPPTGKGRMSSVSTGNLSGSQAVSEEMIPKLKSRKSLTGGHKTLAKLRHRVEECRDLTSEMTSQKTESASARITRSGALRDKLGEAANLCTSLAVHLDDGDDGSRGSEIDLQGLSSRHEEALERIRQLEQQLEKSSVTTTPNEAPSLIKKLAQLDQEHAVVTERSAVLEIEVAKLRKQLSKEQKRAANEQEQLRQNVEERDKLNASLRELLNDNQVVAQKLQSDVQRFRDLHLENQNAVSRMTHKMQRLKAEVKRLQKIEAGSTNGDSRMSIERARHKTGDSTVPPVSVFSPEVVVEENASPSRGSPQWSSTEQLSRKMNDSSILKLSPGSHQSPDIERARHMTDGSEGHPENGILPVVNGEQSWTTAMSSSPDRANRSALRQDNERLSKEVLDLQHQLEEKSAELSETEAKLQGAKRDLRRLSEEVSRMNEELQEKHNLNNTLQMELSVYDQMHNDPARLSGSGETGGSQLDLTMLLEELRQLRKQLVQTIENNNKLRQKLEEQLSQGPARAAHHHYYMKGPNDREGYYPGAHIGFTHLPFGETYLDRTERYRRVSGTMANGQVSISGHMANNNHAPPDQMDRLHETDVESRLQTEALYSSTDSQRWQKSHGRQQPMGGKTSSMSGRIVAHQNGGDSIDSRLVPGGGYKDSSMRYSIHDPMRPPNGKLGNGLEHAHSDSDLSPSRVGSDLRSLYAIGELDDYELLKKEISESITLLSGCEARVKERLIHFQRASPSQNIDHATLRGVSGSIEQLTFCLREQHRLVTLFWTSQLPRRDDQGSTVNQTLLRQNNHLQNQLAFMAPKYEHAKKQLAEAEKRLKEANNGKEQQQAQAVKRLSRHSDTLGSAENNMQLR